MTLTQGLPIFPLHQSHLKVADRDVSLLERVDNSTTTANHGPKSHASEKSAETDLSMPEEL